MSKANKQQVPKIRFNRFKDTWSMEQLANLMSFSNGINAPKESYGKGRKMISVLDILQPKSITYNDIVNSVEVDQATEDRNRVQKGDVIFVRSSEIVEEVGWSKAYLDSEYALHSGFTICGTAKHSDFDNYFVELSLNYTNRQQIERKSGGSTRQNISQSVLSEIKFSLPIKEEQTQISNFFQQLDKLIELHTRAVESAETYKKAMLQKMFPLKGEKVPCVRFEGFSGDWKKSKLGEMFSFSRGEAFGKKDINPDGLFPCIHYGELFTQYNEVIGNSISRTNLQAKKPSEIGDILMPSSDVTPDGLAKASCLNQKHVFLGGDINILRPIKKVSSVFFSYLISYQKNKLLVLVTGSSVKHLYNSDLKSLDYMVPSFEEQTQIGNFFQKLDQNIESEKKKLEQYQTMKRAMLQRMFV